ncbi:Bacterial PH domain protein [uncultured archaeon]|nr:Bacterial PH domain protein [uncultured archaeon]
MEERFRPVVRPYIRLYLGLIVFFVALASIAAILYPEGELAAYIIAGALSALCLLKLLEQAGLHFLREYIIDDNKITEIFGYWITSENHVPIDKIQDYSIDRTILNKLLGLADIGIQTARAERGFEITMRSIPEARAEHLNTLLAELLHRGQAQARQPPGQSLQQPRAGQPAIHYPA